MFEPGTAIVVKDGTSRSKKITSMNDNTEDSATELLRRIDNSLAVIKASRSKGRWKQEPEWVTKGYEQLESSLAKLRVEVIDETLQRQSRTEVPRGTVLGLTKFSGEWCDDGAVLESLASIEWYYKNDY